VTLKCGLQAFLDAGAAEHHLAAVAADRRDLRDGASLGMKTSQATPRACAA